MSVVDKQTHLVIDSGVNGELMELITYRVSDVVKLPINLLKKRRTSFPYILEDACRLSVKGH